MDEIVTSWRGLRTLGALRQALVEAEDEVLHRLPEHFTADEVYVNSNGHPECSVALVAETLTDGSRVYNLRIIT